MCSKPPNCLITVYVLFSLDRPHFLPVGNQCCVAVVLSGRHGTACAEQGFNLHHQEESGRAVANASHKLTSSRAPRIQPIPLLVCKARYLSPSSQQHHYTGNVTIGYLSFVLLSSASSVVWRFVVPCTIAIKWHKWQREDG